MFKLFSRRTAETKTRPEDNMPPQTEKQLSVEDYGKLVKLAERTRLKRLLARNNKASGSRKAKRKRGQSSKRRNR